MLDTDCTLLCTFSLFLVFVVFVLSSPAELSNAVFFLDDRCCISEAKDKLPQMCHIRRPCKKVIPNNPCLSLITGDQTAQIEWASASQCLDSVGIFACSSRQHAVVVILEYFCLSCYRLWRNEAETMYTPKRSCVFTLTHLRLCVNSVSHTLILKNTSIIL